MGYIEDSLAPGEQIVYKTRLHWVIFIWPFVFSLLAYVSFSVGLDVTMRIIVALALLSIFYVPSTYLLSEFAVTNRRVLGKIFTGGRALPTYLEIPLLEIRDVNFNRGLLVKFVNYGTVLITDSHGKKHSYGWLPAEFYRQLHARIERIERILK